MEEDTDADDMSVENDHNRQTGNEHATPSPTGPGWLQNLRNALGMQTNATPQAQQQPTEPDFKIGQCVNYYTRDGTFDAVVTITAIHRDQTPYYYTVSFSDLSNRNEKQTPQNRLKACDPPGSTTAAGLTTPTPGVPTQPAPPIPQPVPHPTPGSKLE